MNELYSDSQPLAVRTKEACHLLGIGRTSLYHLVREGKIPCKKLDRANLFLVAELKKFLKNQPQA